MINSILTLFLLLAVSYIDVGVHGYQTGIGIYRDTKDGDCETYWGTQYVSTSSPCISFSSGGYGGEISEVVFNQGSCVRIYDSRSCTGNSGWIMYSDFSSCGQISGWNDRIWSFGYCSVSQRTVTCPTGSFVRKMYIPETDNLVSGITMHCFAPSTAPSGSPTASINSAGKAPNSGSNRDCGFPAGARGASLYLHGTYQFYYAASGAVCGQGSSTSDAVCGQNQVLRGFTSDIEDLTGLIKGIKAVCMDVQDPAISCSATEFGSLVNIGQCDNSDGASSKTCTISQKLGWGDPDPDQLSDAERNEKEFYSLYAPATASTPQYLQARFRALGTSKIAGVQFSWAEDGTRSWAPVRTKTITVTIPAGTFTTFQQLKGKCGFYGVHTSYVKRIDLTGSKRTETIFMSGLL